MNLLSETLAKWKALTESERHQMRYDAISKKQIDAQDAIACICMVEECLGDGLRLEKNDPIHNQCIALIVKASGKQL